MADPEFNSVFFFSLRRNFIICRVFCFLLLFCVVLCLLPKHPLYTDYRFSINITPIYTTGLK